MIKLMKLLITISLVFSLASPGLGDSQDFKGTNLSSDFLPYYSPPYQYRGSQLLTIVFKTSPEVLRALVPKPLTPAPGDTMSFTIGIQRVREPDAYVYHEAYFSIPVTYGKMTGSYLPVLYLNKALGILAGREVYGYNKVSGEIRFKLEEGRISAQIKREGHLLVTVEFKTAMKMEKKTPMPDSTSFNIKLIPSVQKGSPPEVKQLTTAKIREVMVHKVLVGKAKLELGSSPQDPLKNIPVLQVVRAYCSESDFILDYGEVIHDYLKVKGK